MRTARLHTRFRADARGRDGGVRAVLAAGCSQPIRLASPQTVIRKDSLGLRIGAKIWHRPEREVITDRAMEAWYHSPLHE
jgi:hypothetical protein